MADTTVEDTTEVATAGVIMADTAVVDGFNV
jgi:hypothetical protein